MYQPIVWLFPCGLRGISIRYLSAALPIKGWISLHNHVTYAHNSRIRRRIYGKSALSIPYSPLMDCYFYTSANGEWQVAVYTLLFFFIVSINGLLLLHIYKRRMGCEPYMPYGFPSLSPLTDCYLYTSANEEWACNRVCLMVSFPCLHWWIATSTHLQMKNEHVTVYALWFSFIVSINGLSLLHFCKWRTCM